MIAIKEKNTLGLIYMTSIRLWLMGMLLFIPFVTSFAEVVSPWKSALASMANRLDEVTILILLPPAIWEFYNNYRGRGKPDSLYLILLLPILFLGISGFISGTLNGNRLIVTILGTLAYIKYFLFIFIYAAFFREFDMFKKIFRLLLILAVLVGIVGFMQEITALYFRYVLERNLTDSGSLFSGIVALLAPEGISGGGWRYGVYRVSSLLSHYNLLGLYSLFILTIYLHSVKKINFVVMFSLLAGIVVSVSRTAYAGFVFLAGSQMFKARRWFLVFLVPVGIFLSVMIFNNDGMNMSELRSEGQNIQYQGTVTYREFARQKALEVWGDHPVWGVGPGMFGGSVAAKYRSYRYEEYDFGFILNWFKSLDQLWPQVLAEIGIIGAIELAGLFLSLLAVFFVSGRRATDVELKGLFSGLLTFTVIFLIYTLSGNLNIVSVLLPYCAFAGIGLGCMDQFLLSAEIEEKRKE